MTTVAAIPMGIPLFDEDIDAETAALIAQLALDDLEEEVSTKKGKARAGGPLSDEDLAFQLQYEFLRQQLALVEDEKYARSLASALESDAAILQAHLTAERAAEEDRRAADLVSRGEPLPPPTAIQASLEDPAFVLQPEPPVVSEVSRAFGKLPERCSEWRDSTTTSWGDHDSNEEIEEPIQQRAALEKIARQHHKLLGDNAPSASGSNASIINIYRKPKNVECISCSEHFSPGVALHVPCEHYYCRDCIATLVDLFTRDESLYPLRCCQKTITVTTVFPFISSKLRLAFEAKHAEFSVLSKDRVYCHQPTCSVFLGSSEGLSCTGILCPACSVSTCPKCKQAAHVEEDCAVSAATIELRALALAQGWQTCPGCHTLIELNMGCYHMTCRCRTEFCYLCAARWKTCDCAQWDEDRLVVAARERVENEVGARAARVMAPVVYEQRVQERARALRINHDCEQHNWTYRQGGGRCSECRYVLPSYLLGVLVTCMRAMF
ncbi:hypothetical protein D9619_009199 [Psilocybe cf. subviscida]|uniref:RBR-type E3 ubiquitin transferase n=1 Tax=Psilocybe cf. subviscida TaxID=2480587 RepID=A0A8H5BVW2_9AGAR|nr:hypothetical protein D9619_009199 [Psilocybe cf. subviscida]